MYVLMMSSQEWPLDVAPFYVAYRSNDKHSALVIAMNNYRWCHQRVRVIDEETSEEILSLGLDEAVPIGTVMPPVPEKKSQVMSGILGAILSLFKSNKP